MRRICLSIAMMALLAPPADAAPRAPIIPPRLVARIDNLIATQDNRNVLIQVRGAVASGGWHQARLRPVKADDPHTIVMEFVATPPGPGQAVIEGLLPVHASTSLLLRRGVISVRVVSGSNEITSQILR